MILQPSDKAMYFPSVCLEGSALLGAIRMAEAIAQSADGSNRYLEIKPYTLLKKNTQLTTEVYLEYTPLVPDSLTIEYRQGCCNDTWGRSIGAVPLTELPTDQYSVENSIVTFNNPQAYSEVKLKYSAGFDFTVESDDTILIKSCIGAILEYRQSLLGQGVVRHDGLGISLSKGIPSVNFPPELLIPLKRYKPRT